MFNMNLVTFCIFDIIILLPDTCCAYKCFDFNVDLRFVSMDTAPMSDVISVTSVTSLSECAAECLKKDNCEAFFYHLFLGNCSLHSEHADNITSVSGSGWIGYDFPGGVRSYSTTAKPTASLLITETTAPTEPKETTTPTERADTTASTETTETNTPAETTETTRPDKITETNTPVESTETATPAEYIETTTSVEIAGPNMFDETTETTTPDVASELIISNITPTSTTTSTSSSTTTSTTITPTTTTIQQLWVDSVVDYSSQYRNDFWSAKQIIGQNNVYPDYGDCKKAWAPRRQTQIEWIVVQVAIPLYITNIEIYETYHAGGVREVSVFNSVTNMWDVLWQTTAVTDIQQKRIFSPPIQTPTYKVDQIRIETDCSVAQDWVELDAVRVTGWI